MELPRTHYINTLRCYWNIYTCTIGAHSNVRELISVPPCSLGKIRFFNFFLNLSLYFFFNYILNSINLFWRIIFECFPVFRMNTVEKNKFKNNLKEIYIFKKKIKNTCWRLWQHGRRDASRQAPQGANALLPREQAFRLFQYFADLSQIAALSILSRFYSKIPRKLEDANAVMGVRNAKRVGLSVARRVKKTSRFVHSLVKPVFLENTR